MTIFSRSLIREFTAIGSAVSGVLTAILMTRLLVQLIGSAAEGSVEPEAVAALLGFTLLSYLPIVLIVALFLAVLLALARSHRDSEMHVWFASGQSLASWSVPVLHFALPIALMTAALSLVLTPWSLAQAKEYQRRIQSKDDV